LLKNLVLLGIFNADESIKALLMLTYELEHDFKLDDGSGEDDREQEERKQSGLLLKPRPKTKKPSMYKVLLLNDDYTPMEFVVHVLERFFSKNRQEATDIMLHVHRRGVGVCGVYTYEVAETKVQQVMDFARSNEQPLQCTMEQE
jgi:ATP-dependent Clp protease adaptor protein ClpS